MGRRKAYMSESCGWIFVDNVPLLYERKRVARQLQVETWLDLTQLVEDLKIEKLQRGEPNSSLKPPVGYIV